MHIALHFHFNNEQDHAATTGVAGQICDMIMPGVGDVVSHKDKNGVQFTGRVSERVFHYDFPEGVAVEGGVAVVLRLVRLAVQ